MDGWTGYKGGPTRSGARPDSRPARDPRDDERWSVGIVDADVVENGIRVTGDRVYVARTDGLSVLDASTGDQVWRYTDAAPECGLLLADDTQSAQNTPLVVLAAPDGITEIHENATGTGYGWHRTINCHVDVELADGGALCDWAAPEHVHAVVGRGSTRRVRAHSLFDDATFREAPDVDGTVVPPLAATDCTTYIGVSDGGPTGADRLWIRGDGVDYQVALSNVAGVGSSYRVDPPVASGSGMTVIRCAALASTAVGPDAVMATLDLSSKSGIGVETHELSGLDTSPVVSDGTLYYTAGFGQRLVAAAFDGTARWKIDLPSTHGDVVGPIAVGNVVYLAVDRLLLGYDDEGNEILSREFDAPVVALAGGDPGVYVGTRRAVYALTDVGTMIYQPGR